jgi:hypothetical protein
MLLCIRAFASKVTGYGAGTSTLAILPNTSVSNKFLIRILEIIEFNS